MAARVRFVALTVLLFGTCASASADPVTVTSGGLTVAWDDPSAFRVIGPGLEISGLFVRVTASPQRACFMGCLPGAVINLSSVAGGDGALSLGQSFTATVNGTNYITDRYVGLAGTLAFLAGDVVVPPQQGTDPPLLSSPFQMTGRIVGYAPGDVEGITPLFDVMVAGAGTARLRLVPQADGTFAFPEASYTFEGSDPIPEPATILLCATGLAGVLMRTRRRRTGA